MVRTQILLSEHQHAVLSDLSKRSGLSMAELIRQAVESMLAQRERAASDQALELLGTFTADRTDVSANHDAYLAEEDGR